MAGPETFEKYKTPIYLAGSASAEFFADIGLCAFEAVKVWHLMQTCSSPCAASQAPCHSCWAAGLTHDIWLQHRITS